MPPVPPSCRWMWFWTSRPGARVRWGGLAAAGPVRVGTSAFVTADTPVPGQQALGVQLDVVTRHQAHRVGHPLEFENLDLEGPALLRLLEGRHGLGLHTGELRELAARLAQQLDRARPAGGSVVLRGLAGLLGVTGLLGLLCVL